MITGLVSTTLRLYRIQIAATGALLVAFVMWLVLNLRSLQPLLDSYGDGNCSGSDCAQLLEQIDRGIADVTSVVAYLGLVPVGVGAFWGVLAVALEYETGTAKLALTQSVSRRSWILARLIVLGLLLALAASTVGAALNWWFGAITGLPLARSVEAGVGFSHLRGPAVVGWWLLAFAVGVASGTFLRRVVPAIAVTALTTVSLLVVTNLWLSSIGGRQAHSLVALTQTVETTGLLGLSLMLLGATCWRFERARV